MPQAEEHQNITVRLSRQIIHKARVLAARRATSISGLLAEQIERMAGEEDEYERAKRDSIALMNDGFNSGTTSHRFNRDSLHER